MSTAEQVAGGEAQRAYRQVHISPSSRISVFNFDPMEQAKLWLQLGPVEAARMLVGVLRTALLFGGSVVVDRNQLLEGIFFISMPPDRLAWHLGLEPGAPLPLEVQLLPAKRGEPLPMGGDLPQGPWRRPDGRRGWGVDDSLVAAIEDNHAAVLMDNDPTRVSSPLIALTGGDYEHASDVVRRDSHSSAGGVVEDAWHTADPVVVPQSVWNLRNKEIAVDVRLQGQLAWVDAMRAGRLAVLPGTMGANPLGPELTAELPPNARGNQDVTRLVEALVNLEHPASASPETQCNAIHLDETAPCRRTHVTSRSLVARWLDGVEMEELQPSTRPEALKAEELAVHRSAALAWWTLAYNRAICNRDGLRLLTVHNALPSPSGVLGDAAVEAELAWGLRRPKPGSGDRIRTRIRRWMRSSGDEPNTLPLAGDIVTRLAAFTPAEYCRLQAFDAVGSEALLRSPGRKSLFDLVVAIDEIAGDTTSRSRRMRSTLLRGGVFGAGGLAVVLYDSGVIALSGPLWSVAAVVAAALLAAPWSDMGALRRMSGSQLQSTLRISHDRE